MKKKNQKMITIVHEHPRHVPVSNKNPSGSTIVDQHIRHLSGSFLDRNELGKMFKNYNHDGVVFPTSQKLLSEYPKADKYDEIIAIWTDYFNKKFPANSPLDPDVVKALIASESSFRLDPPENPIAIGIAQITKKTFKIIQDSKGEVKDFIFIKFIQKDLKDPNIAIPMAIRWLFHKKKLAKAKLGKEPTAEEIILEYKGLLKSTTKYKNDALKNFRKAYEKLKGK